MEESEGKVSKHAFLSWSGNLSYKIVEYLKNEVLKDLFSNSIDFFLSSEIGLGAIFDKEIFERLTKSDFGIVCITAENIEKAWVLFESGGIVSKMNNDNLYVFLADVQQEMFNRLNPPLSRIQVAQLNRDGFVSLTKQICKNVLKVENAEYLNSLNDRWDFHEKQLKSIINENKPLPDKYYKQIKYVTNIKEWNLQMPSIFSLYKKEVFLLGLNHAFLLNLTLDHNKDNFLAMIDSLIADPDKKIRIMISDIWDDKVIGSYANMTYALAIKIENAGIKTSLTPSNSRHYLENVIIRERGVAQLQEIKRNKQLEIRAIKIVGDTFVFIDKAEENGLCYFSLLTSRGGLDRPVFTFNKREDATIFNAYSGFVEEGWNSMSHCVWPENTVAKTVRKIFGRKNNT